LIILSFRAESSNWKTQLGPRNAVPLHTPSHFFARSNFLTT
jgi:hypothetical protein